MFKESQVMYQHAFGFFIFIDLKKYIFDIFLGSPLVNPLNASVVLI